MQRAHPCTRPSATHFSKGFKGGSIRQPRPAKLSNSSSASAQEQLQDALGEGRTTDEISHNYDRLTAVLAASSVVPALVLAVQPLVAGGAAAAAAAVDWQGPLRDMFSFTVLLSVFIGCEPGAAAASAVSAAGAGLMLFAGPGLPPWVACCTAAALAASATLVVATTCIPGSSSSSNNSSSSSSGSSLARCFRWQPERVLRRVQQPLGVFGGGLLTQYFSSLGDSLAAAAACNMQWLAAVAAGALAAFAAGRLAAASGDEQLQALWEDWPAWSATLLLILQPLQQLVDSSFQPLQLLPGMCASRQLLLVLASGLMVPRALLQAELMWFTGTCSGSLLAAGQIAVMAAHHCMGSSAPQGLSSSAATVGAAAGARAVQLQQWAMGPGSAEPCGRAAATITAMCLALLATCLVLQWGWLHIANYGRAEAAV